MTVYSAPPPGSGVLLNFMLNILKDLVPAKNDNILWQRIVETFKWASAKRTELADPDFVEMGTCNSYLIGVMKQTVMVFFIANFSWPHR